MLKGLITPLLGLLGGTPDFSALKLGPIGIGSFFNAVIAFALKAAGLYFLIVLPYNRFAARPAPPAPPPPPPSADVVLLGEIRDLLKAKA
jgi:large conductance mechanosensitive channel